MLINHCSIFLGVAIWHIYIYTHPCVFPINCFLKFQENPKTLHFLKRTAGQGRVRLLWSLILGCHLANANDGPPRKGSPMVGPEIFWGPLRPSTSHWWLCRWRRTWLHHGRILSNETETWMGWNLQLQLLHHVLVILIYLYIMMYWWSFLISKNQHPPSSPRCFPSRYGNSLRVI